MAKQVTKSTIRNLMPAKLAIKPDNVIVVPAHFTADHVKVLKVTDAAKSMNVDKDKLITVEYEVNSGPLKGTKAIVVIDSNEEIEVKSTPKKKGWLPSFMKDEMLGLTLACGTALALGMFYLVEFVA